MNEYMQNAEAPDESLTQPLVSQEEQISNSAATICEQAKLLESYLTKQRVLLHRYQTTSFSQQIPLQDKLTLYSLGESIRQSNLTKRLAEIYRTLALNATPKVFL